MLYPVYVHLGDEQHAHGAVIPDFPGCHSAADELEALPRAVQEAVEVYFEGEDMAIPAPTPLDVLAKREEFADGGVWMLMDIDLARVATKGVRVNVMLPGDLLRRIDDYTRSHHLSRSGFLAQASTLLLESSGQAKK